MAPFTYDEVLSEFSEAQRLAYVHEGHVVALPTDAQGCGDAELAYKQRMDQRSDDAFNGRGSHSPAERKLEAQAKRAARELKRLEAVNAEQARILFEAYEAGEKQRRHANLHSRGAKCYVTGCTLG